MTRIGLFIIIMSFCGSAGAVKPDCQGDLFSKTPDVTPARSADRKPFADLVMMQKQLWDLRSGGKIDEYNFLHGRMKTQLMLTKRNKLAGARKNHKIYEATGLSYAIFREGRQGRAEILTYELNEELGGPVKIPFTVSQLDGSLQLWMDYTVPGKTPLMPDERRLGLKRTIAKDADLFLFRFLTVNGDQHAYNLIMDRDAGMVIFDFDLAYALSLKVFVFSTLEFDAEATGKEKPQFDAQLTYAKLEEILKEKLKTAKFDWRSALNRMDTERIVDLAAFRLNDRFKAEALRARICILRTLLNGGDISNCSIP